MNHEPNPLVALFNSRAGAKRRARLLIPLEDLSHPGILTNIVESKVVQMDVGRSMVMAVLRMRKIWMSKIWNQQPPDWLRQKVRISITNVSNLIVILQNIFSKWLANFNKNKRWKIYINNTKKIPEESRYSTRSLKKERFIIYKLWSVFKTGRCLFCLFRICRKDAVYWYMSLVHRSTRT